MSATTMQPPGRALRDGVTMPDIAKRVSASLVAEGRPPISLSTVRHHNADGLLPAPHGKFGLSLVWEWRVVERFYAKHLLLPRCGPRPRSAKVS
jgi:hypothetical protein